MLLTPAEILRHQPTGSWFCLRGQPKREHIAAACLRQISEIEVFCPRLRFRKPTTRGPVWFVEPMFPGYLFARFDYAAFNRQINQSPGVSGLVRFGDRLARLLERRIVAVRSPNGAGESFEMNK